MKNDPQPPADFDLFTGVGSKTPDFAIYYNIAIDNLNKADKHIKTWSSNNQYAFLAEFLWKAHKLKRNSFGYQLSAIDIEIIKMLREKVDALRNYHSHIWHDNIVLKFNPRLKEFVEQKYEEAKAALFAEFPGAVSDYEQLQQKPAYKKFQLFKHIQHKGHYITQEGRIFFLSFFLTSGQMSQLMQQRKGFKRTDMPLFKIKRLLYTYYCHRDGASLTSFSHSEDITGQLDHTQRTNLLRARTAYKLVNYLFDYPHYWANPEWMPLHTSKGEAIQSVVELKDYIEDHPDLLPGLTFRLINRSPSDSRDEKELEENIRTGTISFTSIEIPGYIFHITFDTLYRLVLLQLLPPPATDNMMPAALLIQNLKLQTANRGKLYAILIKPPSERTQEEWEYLGDRKNQHLRGRRRLTELGITYFEAMGKELEEKSEQRCLLLNYLRSTNAPWHEPPVPKKSLSNTTPFEPEPVLVYQQDYVMGTVQKFRSGNRFVLYAAKYLLDFGGDLWHWGMEKFEMGRKDKKATSDSLLKRKTYLPASRCAADNDYRLTVENDHIYLAIPRRENTGANHEQFYQFSLGPQTMRYLATYFIEKKEAPENILLFLQTIAADLEKLNAAKKWDSGTDYKLLEKPFVQRFLHQEASSMESLKRSLTARIKYIEQKWEYALAHKQQLSRAQKNRMIMDAYRLFDWSIGVNGHPKFFRAAEFNEMSVCHYSLQKKNDSNSLRGRHFKNLDKFDHLFNKVFELNVRKPPIPDGILNLLKKASSLDDLMEKVWQDRKAFLNGQLKNLSILPAQQLKKELPSLCRIVGISVPAGLLKEGEQSELRKKQHTTLSVQPFAIHPMLVVKYFFPEIYNAGKEMDIRINKNGEEIKTRPVLHILSNIRKNNSYKNRLFVDFYDSSHAYALYPAENHKKTREKLIGEMNTACTEDILLWKIARDYLKNNSYTDTLAKFINNHVPGGETLGQLLKLPVKFPLRLDNRAGEVYASVLLHQLDDFIFITQYDHLQRAAHHFLHRQKEEAAYWQHTFPLSDASSPDGSKDSPIPFQLLTTEIELVRRTGNVLAERILAFERDVYNTALRQLGTKEALQRWLTNEWRKSSYHNKFPVQFLNFQFVLGLARDQGKEIGDSLLTQLDEYRNMAFHNDIPTTGSFSWVTREGQPLRKLLNIAINIDTPKDRAKYKTGQEAPLKVE